MYKRIFREQLMLIEAGLLYPPILQNPNLYHPMSHCVSVSSAAEQPSGPQWAVLTMLLHRQLPLLRRHFFAFSASWLFSPLDSAQGFSSQRENTLPCFHLILPSLEATAVHIIFCCNMCVQVQYIVVWSAICLICVCSSTKYHTGC